GLPSIGPPGYQLRKAEGRGGQPSCRCRCRRNERGERRTLSSYYCLSSCGQMAAVGTDRYDTRMRIFLGSSGERLDDLTRIGEWVAQAGHEPCPWNKPGLFPIGHFTFESLNEIKDKVDASIFIFSDDDKVWYRRDLTPIPRDN